MSNATANKHNADMYVRHSEAKRLTHWSVDDGCDDVFFTATDDGWTLAITAYTPADKVNKNHAYPVLLCHGLGSNRFAYGIDDEHSLALYLVEQGYDVYAVDLRGHGRSEKPGQYGKKWGWGFNEYCDHDIPTAIDAVLERASAAKLHFIGHSMGGILLYAHTAVANPKIQSGITLASTLDYSQDKSVFKALIKLTPLCHLVPSIPVHWPALFSSWASQYSRKFIDPVLVYPKNVATETFRKMASNAMHPVSNKVLIELTRAINGKGMTSSNGRGYIEQLKEKGYAFPILAITGEGDIQCTPKAGGLFGTHWKSFGRSYGHQEHYGHDDLVMGRNARTEVWPSISEWLSEHSNA